MDSGKLASKSRKWLAVAPHLFRRVGDPVVETTISAPRCRSCTDWSTAAEVDTSIVRYPDAQHGFHCDDRPAVYDESAAHDGWDLTQRWFESHVASR